MAPTGVTWGKWRGFSYQYSPTKFKSDTNFKSDGYRKRKRLADRRTGEDFVEYYKRQKGINSLPPTPTSSSKKNMNVDRVPSAQRNRGGRRNPSAAARTAFKKVIRGIRLNNRKKRYRLSPLQARHAYAGNTGATHSTSSGKFAKGATKVVRTAKSKKWRILKSGIIHTQETGALFQSDYCRYVGHATWVPSSILLYTCASIIKQLYYKVGRNPTSIDTTFVDSTLDTVTFTYRLNDDAATGLTTVSLGTVAASPTILSMGTTLMNALQAIVWNKSTRLVSMFYKPTAATASMNYYEMELETARVMLELKNTLKLQNRSVTSGGEADDVDNVPVYGKFYEGSGSGCYKKGGTFGVFPFSADDFYGVMARDGVTTDTKEPLIPETLQYTKKTGKAKLEPGEIKTSTLESSHNMYLRDLLEKLLVGTSASVSDHSRMGKFRLFAFEKMLEIYPTTIIPLKIAMEHNQKMQVGFKEGWQKPILCQTFNSAAYPY